MTLIITAKITLTTKPHDDLDIDEYPTPTASAIEQLAEDISVLEIEGWTISVESLNGVVADHS